MYAPYRFDRFSLESPEQTGTLPTHFMLVQILNRSTAWYVPPYVHPRMSRVPHVVRLPQFP